MSFSSDLKNELLETQLKKNCCKKSFLFGLIINAKKLGSKNLCIEFPIECAALKTVELLKSIYLIDALKEPISKPGKQYYRVTFESQKIITILSDIEKNPEATVQDTVGFKCQLCEHSFLRGVFISCGRLNDPLKGYHLEFTFASENVSKASKLYRFLSVSGFVSKIINRTSSTGLYFKSNSTISDILYFLGAVGASFEYANAGITKDIRNNENRATNCVTRNIYKSINASQKQAQAIKKLISSHKIDTLPPELKQTALIRIENKDASLAELASLHNPPISKSGLNHRLAKLCDEAENLFNDQDQI